MNFENLQSIFSLPLFRNALIVGVLIAICSAILGVEVVLKKYSMLGDGLSHVSFGTLAVASAFNGLPLEFSIIVVIVVAFLLLQIRQNSKINGDAAVAVVSGSFMALGIFATKMAGGSNIDFDSYMMGSPFAITNDVLPLCVIMCVAVIVVYCLFYNKIFAVTFDENFCKATGGKPGLYNLIIAILTAVTIVIGIKLIGTLLISSLTVFPVVSSLRVSKTFKGAVIISTSVSVASYIIGYLISLLCADFPLSSAVIMSNLMFMLACYLFSSINKKGAKAE